MSDRGELDVVSGYIGHGVSVFVKCLALLRAARGWLAGILLLQRGRLGRDAGHCTRRA